MSNTPPKTILHLIDTTGPGGAETVFLTLAKACTEQGMRSIAVIRGPGWVENQLKKLGIEYHIINSKGSFNWRYLRALLNIAKTENVTLIQSHLLGSNVYGGVLGLLLRIPVVATFHGHVDISPNERLRTVKLGIIALAARRVVAVTRDLAEEIKALGNKRLARKTVVIPNGINTEALEHLTPRARRSEDPLVLGCLGNVRTAKNYKLAVDFTQYLHEQGIKVELNIAGDNTNQLAQELIQYAETLDVVENIHFLGFIDNIARFFEQIDVFLMTSSSEGHPLAITQALAAGKPILTTPNGVEKVILPELLNVSEAHSAESLYIAMQTMLESGFEQAAGENEKQSYVRKHFSLQAMISGYFSFYDLKAEPT
ncbi:MAG: glycosyltransferase family 4 protein [Saccharospirillum sp.]|nr:glycosyltransferase family 4 protein [Saccharospirillum sp.]